VGFLNFLNKTYHRNLLEKFLLKYKHLVKGKILDIGSKNRRYDHLFEGEITAIDVLPRPEFDVIKGDLINLSLQSNSFDSILCVEVFEYLEPGNFKTGFKEIHKVLRRNGKAIITLPFYYTDHLDNIRVTYSYLLNYLTNLTLYKIKMFKFGNKYTSLYDMIRYSKIRKKSNKSRNYLYNFILLFLYIAIRMFSLESKQDLFYSGIFIILTKL